MYRSLLCLKLSHANVVLRVLCAACANGCSVLTHALVLQWAYLCVANATVVCAFVLRLAFANYACVGTCDN